MIGLLGNEEENKQLMSDEWIIQDVATEYEVQEGTTSKVHTVHHSDVVKAFNTCVMY